MFLNKKNYPAVVVVVAQQPGQKQTRGCVGGQCQNCFNIYQYEGTSLKSKEYLV